MKVIKVADDGTITVELSAIEASDVRDDLNAAEWSALTDSAKALYHFLDMVREARKAREARPAHTVGQAGIFPGGGF